MKRKRRESKKASGKKPPLEPTVKEKILAEIRAQKLTYPQIAAKFGLNVNTILGYVRTAKAPIKAPEPSPDWPGDTAGQLKRFLSAVCKRGEISGPAMMKELAGAAETLAKIILTYDERARTLTPTESKSSSLDLSKLSPKDVQMLAALEQILGGDTFKAPPNAAELEAPVVYDDTTPDGFPPKEEPEVAT